VEGRRGYLTGCVEGNALLGLKGRSLSRDNKGTPCWKDGKKLGQYETRLSKKNGARVTARSSIKVKGGFTASISDDGAGFWFLAGVAFLPPLAGSIFPRPYIPDFLSQPLMEMRAATAFPILTRIGSAQLSSFFAALCLERTRAEQR